MPSKSSSLDLTPDERAAVSAFWWQRVYFDATPVRRWELVPTLAATPGMTETAALSLLYAAEVAEDSPVEFADDLDADGRWVTVAHQHVHIDKSGKIDAGGGSHVRKLLGQQTVGDRVRGVVNKVKGAAKKLGRKLGRAEDRLNDAVERGSEKVYEYLKGKGKAAVAKGTELAKKYGPAAVSKGKELARKYGSQLREGAKKYGKAGGIALGKGALSTGKAIVKVGGSALRRVGSAIKGGLSSLWARLKGGPRTTADKIQAVKKEIRAKKQEQRLSRLQSKLESLTNGGGSQRTASRPTPPPLPAAATVPAPASAGAGGGASGAGSGGGSGTAQSTGGGQKSKKRKTR